MNLENLKKKHNLTDDETKQAQEPIAKALTNLCSMAVVLAFLELITAGDIEEDGNKKVPQGTAIPERDTRENISPQ
ncbi:MAG: hypothetical protein K0Q48_674 [Bacillota bacterium]|jgi:hypothetical protein|nr:hypothetical protein [Bacillota bacterium]